VASCGFSGRLADSVTRLGKQFLDAHIFSSSCSNIFLGPVHPVTTVRKAFHSSPPHICKVEPPIRLAATPDIAVLASNWAEFL
jgi:hypothetical protein